MTVTMTSDPRATQRMTALDLANQVRADGAALKRDLKAGRITLADALADDRASHLSVIALLTAQHRWGRSRALRVLRDQMIGETKRVETLTARQRVALAEACR